MPGQVHRAGKALKKTMCRDVCSVIVVLKLHFIPHRVSGAKAREIAVGNVEEEAGRTTVFRGTYAEFLVVSRSDSLPAHFMF